MSFCELTLMRGERRARGWVEPETTRLEIPREGGPEQVEVATSFLPDALARLNDLGPRPRVEPAVTIRLPPGDLARMLAARSPAGLSARLGQAERAAAERLTASLAEHWRVELSWSPAAGSPGVRVVEVLDTAEGLWLVLPRGEQVELVPTTPTTVWRLLTALLPRAGELAGAPGGGS